MLSRIRRCDLVGGCVLLSLRVGFEVSKAHPRPSFSLSLSLSLSLFLALSLMPKDQDAKLPATARAMHATMTMMD